MKKHSIRFLAILFAMLMTLSALSACGTKTDTPETTTGTADATIPEASGTAEDTQILPDIPDMIWNREFRILGTSDDRASSTPSFELYVAELNGEMMNDAIFERNEIMERKYGITVVQTLVKDTADKISVEFASNDDSYDLVFAFINKVGGLAQKGYFLDMNDIEYIDFTKPWWNPEVNEAVSIKEHIFYTSSDFSLRDKNRISVMMCNENLRKELQLDYVPDLVREGKWTAEKCLSLVKAASIDLNGDGKHEASDQYGLAMHSYNAFAALCFGCGVRLIGKDADDGLVIAANPDHDSAAIDKVLAICSKEYYMTPENYDRNWAIAADTYSDGRVLLGSTLLASVANFSRDCEFDFVVAPNPKFDEEQAKYYTIPDVYCLLFAVPATVRNSSFVGFALEAFSAASTETTYTTYIELLCKSRNVRNADSAAMIDTIFNGIVYDNAIFYSDSIPLYGILNKNIPSSDDNVFLRMLNTYKKPAQNAIDSINNQFNK